MDKFTRDFFNSILTDGGSPVSTSPAETVKKADIKDSLRKLGDYFSKLLDKVKAMASRGKRDEAVKPAIDVKTSGKVDEENKTKPALPMIPPEKPNP